MAEYYPCCPHCDCTPEEREQDAFHVVKCAEGCDDDPVCSSCKMPAAQRDGKWEHAEPADAIACAIFRGAW